MRRMRPMVPERPVDQRMRAEMVTRPAPGPAPMARQPIGVLMPISPPGAEHPTGAGGGGGGETGGGGGAGMRGGVGGRKSYLRLEWSSKQDGRWWLGEWDKEGEGRERVRNSKFGWRISRSNW